MGDLQQDNQFQLVASDLLARIREIEEKTNSVKERLLLFGKNLIETKEELEERAKNTDKETVKLTQLVKEISNNIKLIEEETNNFVRKDEIILVERMLKDFKPLEFVRTKDLEESVLEILSKNKTKSQTNSNPKE